MQINKYVASNENYIKADVEIEKGTDYEWIIERVTEEELENQGRQDTKPCLWFVGQEKGLVLNKTNARMLIDNFASDDNSGIPHQTTIGASHTLSRVANSRRLSSRTIGSTAPSAMAVGLP